MTPLLQASLLTLCLIGMIVTISLAVSLLMRKVP